MLMIAVLEATQRLRHCFAAEQLALLPADIHMLNTEADKHKDFFGIRDSDEVAEVGTKLSQPESSEEALNGVDATCGGSPQQSSTLPPSTGASRVKHCNQRRELMVRAASEIGNARGRILAPFGHSTYDNFRTFFCCIHPVLAFRHDSIVRPPGLRALLVTMNVFGALFVSALFFSSTGVRAIESPDECIPSGTLAEIVTSLTVGAVASAISVASTLVVNMLHQRKLTFAPHVKAANKILVTWVVMDVVLWNIAAAYLAFCLVFVSTFLANISGEASDRWLCSSITSFFSEMLFGPAVVAAAHTTAVELLRCQHDETA
jgi:hypothetical protein